MVDVRFDIDKMVNNAIRDVDIYRRDIIPKAVSSALPRTLGRGGRSGLRGAIVKAVASATGVAQKLFRGRVRIFGRFEYSLTGQRTNGIHMRVYSDDIPATVLKSESALARIKNPSRVSFAGERFPTAFWGRKVGGRKRESAAQRLRRNPDSKVGREIFYRPTAARKPILKAKVRLNEKMGVVPGIVRQLFPKLFDKELRDQIRFQTLKAQGKIRGKRS